MVIISVFTTSSLCFLFHKRFGNFYRWFAFEFHTNFKIHINELVTSAVGLKLNGRQ